MMVYAGHSKIAMTWGTVEREPEVVGWLEHLRDEEFGHVAFYIDLLEREGVHLGEPYTRQLRGKLRERVRLSYYIASGRRIVPLTIFRNTRQREEAEIDRAVVAMRRCIAEDHIAEEDW